MRQGNKVLFTGLTNPASNALYPRLGYEPLADPSVFLISPGRQARSPHR